MAHQAGGFNAVSHGNGLEALGRKQVCELLAHRGLMVNNQDGRHWQYALVVGRKCIEKIKGCGREKSREKVSTELGFDCFDIWNKA